MQLRGGRRDPDRCLTGQAEADLDGPAPVGGVGRNINRAAGALDPALEGLADPPGGIGRELVPLGPVELLDGPDQPETPLLDEVQEVHTGTLVALGPVDDEAEVG